MQKTAYVLGWLGILLLTILLPATASAQDRCTHHITVVGPASVRIDPTIPIGAVLWTGSVENLASSPAIPGCPGPGTATLDFAGNGAAINNIYATEIPGIGYRVRLDAGQTRPCSYSWFPTSCPMIWGGVWSPAFASIRLEVQLVKTGRITIGGKLSGEFARQTYNSNVFATFNWDPAVSVVPNTPTCKISNPSIKVPLGSVPVSTFTGLNSMSSSVPFEIALLCSGGDSGRTIAVRVTLTDGTDPTNRTTSLALTRTSTSKGLAIQVLKNNQPIAYGPASSQNGNTNQWFAGNASNGIFKIPLAARYVQVGQSVSAGSANGAAIFTMNYQ